MTTIRCALALAVALLPGLLSADVERPECATSPLQQRFVQEAGAWAAARAQTLAAAKGLPPAKAALHDNVILLPADDLNSPFRRPVDLEGRSLIFVRSGRTGFRATATAIQWESGASQAVTLDGMVGEERYGRVELGFDFPFFDQLAGEVFVTSQNAILLREPSSTVQVKQLGDHDLATESRAVIAPLMTTVWSQLIAEPPAVAMRRSADSVTITWTSPEHEVQAVLRRIGDIRFNYRRVGRLIVGGAVVITPGQGAWREQRTPIASTTDATGDAPASAQEPIASMIDITGVTVYRIADLDLVEMRIQSRGPISTASMTEEDFLLLEVQIGENAPFEYIRFWLQPGTDPTYGVTAWGYDSGSAAARVEGSEISLTFLDEHLANPSTLPVRVTIMHSSGQDSVDRFTVPFGGGSRTVRTDLSAANDLLIDDRPVVEAFTAAVLSPESVWRQVRQSYPQLTDDAIDGVAIYQNFLTDLATYAGAYSTRGNSGAVGLWPGDEKSASRPRRPALLHMNAIGFRVNRTTQLASRVLMHELGHRWLFSVGLMENDEVKSTLNPLSAHPAQYVDTRSAFRVYTDRDTSVMGGGHFTDNGNGTFTSGPYGPFGYSWLDLYLMGLARPSEVADFFYIAGSSPTLGGAYYAPPDRTYSGTRRNVSLQQIVAATGVRKPAYPDTQRLFRMVVVVVFDPARGVSDEELATVHEYLRAIDTDFRAATNARASVVFDVGAPPPPPTGPRRRAVRR